MSTTKLDISRKLRDLRRMTVRELKERYVEVFGEQSRSGNGDFLRKRIAWRLQVLAEGDITERAERRAAELADDADLRIRAPRPARAPEPSRTRPSGLRSRIHSCRPNVRKRDSAMAAGRLLGYNCVSEAGLAGIGGGPRAAPGAHGRPRRAGAGH